MPTIKESFKKQGVHITPEKEREIAADLAVAGMVALQAIDTVESLTKGNAKVATYALAMNLVTTIMSSAPVSVTMNPTDPGDCLDLCESVLRIVIDVMAGAGSFKTAATARRDEIADVMKWP